LKLPFSLPGQLALIGHRVRFIDDFSPENLLQDVLQRDQTGESPIFVNHHKKMLFQLQKLGQHLIQFGCLSHEMDRPHQFRQMLIHFSLCKGHEDVLGINQPYHVLYSLIVDGYSAVFKPTGRGHGLLKGQVFAQGKHDRPGRHDVFDHPGLKGQNAVDDLLLVNQDAAASLAQMGHDLDLFRGNGILVLFPAHQSGEEAAQDDGRGHDVNEAF